VADDDEVGAGVVVAAEAMPVAPRLIPSATAAALAPSAIFFPFNMMCDPRSAAQRRCLS
jgi:hypothetical protein